MAVLAQPLDRALDPALVVQPRLARPDVEVDAEVLEAGLDAGADPAGRPAPEDVRRVGAIGGGGLAQTSSGHGRREVRST